jgi:hypothetical protein
MDARGLLFPAITSLLLPQAILPSVTSIFARCHAPGKQRHFQNKKFVSTSSPK